MSQVDPHYNRGCEVEGMLDNGIVTRDWPEPRLVIPRDQKTTINLWIELIQ